MVHVLVKQTDKSEKQLQELGVLGKQTQSDGCQTQWSEGCPCHLAQRKQVLA